MDTKLKAEQWLYVLFAASLPFATLLQLRFVDKTVQLSDLLFLASAIVWVFRLLIRRKDFVWSWFYLCLAAYALSVVLSTVTSVNPSQSSVKLFGKFYLIGISFLTVNILSSGGVLKSVLQGWICGAGIALFLSLLGIVLFYAGLKDPSQNLVVHPVFGSLPSGNYPRIEGFFSYPAMFCNYLSVSWMFAFLLVSAGWLKRGSFWIFSIVLFVVDAFTLTPGLGGIFLVAGYFFSKKLEKAQKPALGRWVFATGVLAGSAFLFAAAFTVFTFSKDGIRIPLANGEITASHRAVAWSGAFETFLQNPVFGYGLDMPVTKSEFTGPFGNRHTLTDAHNTYLSVLGETGLAGFLAFMSIICFLTWRLMQWNAKTEFHKTIRICLLLALVDAFFYQGLTGSYEDSRHIWVLFGIAAAVCKNPSFFDDKNDAPIESETARQ
ncbi:MAG: O-antigen ligase family protein [Pyrinomonadaceae bacterium]